MKNLLLATTIFLLSQMSFAVVEIDHELVHQSVKRAYAFDHGYNLSVINDLTVFGDCGERGGIASSELYDFLNLYSFFDPSIIRKNIWAWDGLAAFIYDNVIEDMDRDGGFFTPHIYYCVESRYSPLRLKDIARMIIEYKKIMK